MTSPFIQQIADNRVCQVLTCLPEKFVVDFANGIDVAQEHIRTAGERTFFRRLKEGLTGEGAARQNAINASLAQGVEASLRWLTEMTTSLATTIQSLPRGQQKEALLASAALPLLFRPREVQGTMFGDGGMGGWRNMQGNTPVTPLVDAGCNMVIVTHLSDGSLWDRQAFPDTTILEIRPRKRLKYAGDGGNSGGLLSFTSAHTDAWRQQGYEDTMLAMEHIRKPLAARQALTRSEAVLQKSLDITEEADLALRNAMARIK